MDSHFEDYKASAVRSVLLQILPASVPACENAAEILIFVQEKKSGLYHRESLKTFVPDAIRAARRGPNQT